MMYTEEIYIKFINKDIQRHIKTRLSISNDVGEPFRALCIENNETIKRYVKLNIGGVLDEEPAS
jgi:hypothetical protein